MQQVADSTHHLFHTGLGAQTHNQKKIYISEIRKVLKHKTIVCFVLKIRRGNCVQILASILYLFIFYTCLLLYSKQTNVLFAA